jgi:hypothetical protein
MRNRLSDGSVGVGAWCAVQFQAKPTLLHQHHKQIYVPAKTSLPTD